MANVEFKKLIQNTHEYNTNGIDILESEIHLNYKNKDFTINIRQPSGVNFEETDGIELIIPSEVELLKELNYNDFSDECEEYYRNLIGSRGNAINFGHNSQNIIMKNNHIIQSKIVNIPLAEDNGTTW